MPSERMEPLINYGPAMDKPNDSWTDEELRLGEWARARDRELRIEPLFNSRVNRAVVMRLVGGDREGQWWMIPDDEPFVIHRFQGPSATMVPTGTVEWDGNRCAEVYVPADRLDEWRAEHDVE